MNIYTPEYECKDLELLDESVEQHLKGHKFLIPTVPSKSDFLAIAPTLPDLIYGLVSPIARKPVKDHRFLWARTLEFVVSRASALVEVYQAVQSQSRPDSDFRHVVKELKEVLDNLISFVTLFLGQAEGEFLDVGSAHSDSIRRSFTTLLCESLEMALNARSITANGDFLDTLANCIVNTVNYVEQKKYKEWEHKITSQSDVMPVIVAFCRTSFLLGVPDKIVPLFAGGRPVVSETFPFNFVANLDTNLPLLVDFYRYAGFCLVTLSIMDDSVSHIKSEYADLANNFFVPLLTLPNLSLSNYVTVNDLPNNPSGITSAPTFKSGQYILEQNREEISFFYVISYILRLKSLSSLVEPVPRFQAEMCFFANSFGRRISSDLDLLASSHQSYSNSTISMLSLEQRASAAAPTANGNTLSTILTEGTYKEKLHLVKIFFDTLATLKYSSLMSLAKLIRAFNFESVPEGSLLTNSMKTQDFHHLLSNVDIHAFPGKKLYVRAVDKIVRLIQLLTLLHLQSTLGLDSQPSELLANLYRTTYTFEQISKVQPLLEFNRDGRLQRTKVPRNNEEHEIVAQFDMIAATRDLKQVMR